MSKKIIVDNFSGERPRVTNDDLPQRSASLAVNTRLSNGDIRAYPQFSDSEDDNSELSLIVTGGYTNFFKASNEAAINWMSWTSNDKISTLEVRYNDINAYEFPEAPRINVQAGEQLGVGFSGRYVTNQGSGSTEDWRAAFTTGAFENGVDPGLTYPFNQFVQAEVPNELDTITTYAWTYVSGDMDILPINGSNNQNQEFATTLAFPSVPRLANGNTKSAVYRCTVTDASGNTGTKEITISFTAYIYQEDRGGGPGGRPDDGIYEWDLF